MLLQEEIHELLLSFAEAGATVVRLKGGDPLVSSFLLSHTLPNFLYVSFLNVFASSIWIFQVFGRGGEEMDFLQQQGIRVQVIPGNVFFLLLCCTFIILVTQFQFTISNDNSLSNSNVCLSSLYSSFLLSDQCGCFVLWELI